MAKIAALVVPAARAGHLDRLARDMADALSLGGELPVERRRHDGPSASAVLLRVGADPLNPDPQPAACGPSATVLCGYVLPGEPAAAGAERPVGMRHLVRALHAEGADGLRRLDGVYAFAAWNERAEQLVAGVDKLGMRPLFWTRVAGGGCAVASEIKALVPVTDDAGMNWAAVEEQLAFGYQLGEHTLFAGIHRFAPAEALLGGAAGLRRTIVEEFVASIEAEPRLEPEFLEENDAVFRAAVGDCLAAAPGRTGTVLTLSGGLDSRRLLGGLLLAGERPEVLTVASHRAGEPDFEAGLARAVACAVGLEGRLVRPPAAADAELIRRVRDLAADGETNEHWYYAILALAAPRPGAVNMDGLSGDTLVNPAWFLRGELLEPGGDDRFLDELVPRLPWFRLPGAADRPPLSQRVRERWARYQGHRNRYTMFALHERGRRALALGPMLVQAHAFESLYPFLDRRFIRSALVLDPRQRIGTLLQRPLIERLGLRALDSVPSTRDQRPVDERYALRHPAPAGRAARDPLRAACARPRLPDGTGIPPREVAKLRAIAVLRALRGRGDPLVHWHTSKSAAALRVLDFLERAQSPAHYATSLGALRGAYGSRTSWVGPL